MNECQTVTLVWHKHTGKPLSNLDMRLYDAGTQVLIDFSTSTKDNVEQVKVPSGRDRTVYLRIVHWGSETETFGLAVPSKFESIAQPFTPYVCNALGRGVHRHTVLRRGWVAQPGNCLGTGQVARCFISPMVLYRCTGGYDLGGD